MTRKERGRLCRCLIDDVDAVGGNNFRGNHSVDKSTIWHRKDDVITRHECIEMAERFEVARTVAGDDHVAGLAWHRASWPMAWPLIERCEADALEHGHAQTDLGDLKGAKFDTNFCGAGVSR